MPQLASVRCGFEVESVSEKELEGLDVFNWPGIEKRTEEFSQTAAPDMLKMIYVKEGSGVLTEGAETAAVSAGQMVMISDGTVKWTSLADGGVILLSIETPVDDDDDDVSGPAGAEVEPFTLEEGVRLLGAGLLSGAIIALAVKLIQTM